MAVNIKFDLVGNPEPPTIILSTRNGNKLGQLDVDEKSIEIIDRLNDVSELTFTLHKYVDGKIANLWDKVTNFKLVYCKEWDTYFEITVELDEETETVKTVFCKQLGQAELSQIMLYNIEINTEKDIECDDYKRAILYDDFDHEASILHRLLKDKAPHYSVIHVDSTIAKIQRSFSFDETSIYDALQEISEEIGCLFVFNSNSDKQGNIQRTISVYDLEANCNDCGHREQYINICPKCGGSNVTEGYGNDTTIFITSDELAENIQLTTDTDSVKNCFKLEAGDDLMTATIRNCNPNGTDYLWHILDTTKADMSSDLVEKLNEYDDDYDYYQNQYAVNLDSNIIEKYNSLVRKYKVYNEELEEIQASIVGYPALMQAYYNTVDLELYLESSLMPSVKTSDTTAEKESNRLISGNISPVSAENIEYMSKATADNIILSMAKILVDSRYKVKVNESSFDETTKVWNGNFEVVNYSDDDDRKISSKINVVIDDNYKNFVQQKIDKALNKENTDDLSITGLFEKENEEFSEELKKYSLNCLTSFYNSCQSCIDILIDQGIGNKETWFGKDPNLYDDLYLAYLRKLEAIEYETKVRQDELNIIVGIYNADGEIKTYGLQNYIAETQDYIHNQLNFEKYFGQELWHEFCSFRREDKYSNENYISDGLSNAELFDNALKFIEVASKEIYKSAELQHSISSSLRNLLAIKKFEPLVKHFKVGNWLRILIDGNIYKLRLIEYSINYGDFDNISVEFSDVINLKNNVTSVQGVLNQASKMATSYESVQKQAAQGQKVNSILDGWSLKGMDVTNTKIIQGADNQSQTWDEHGMLFKKYDEVTDSYSDTQLKIVNSTMAITDDNWKTVKTAVGEYYYFHPETNELTKAYGVNGEVIVGKLIIGEQLGIYNATNTLKFDTNGFEVTNGTNSFKITPNEDMLLCISKGAENVFYVDKNGKLSITGDGSGLDISGTTVITDLVNGNGTTKINGGCIETNTINASSIVTGTITADKIQANSITWNNLDSTTQNKINNAGISSDSVYNIVSTEIDEWSVSSPTIKGCEIIGGTISGGEFSNLNGTTWVEIGSDYGADNDAFGLVGYNGNSRFFAIYNGDFGYTSFCGKDGYYFLITNGDTKKTEACGTWDFSGATVILPDGTVIEP